MKALLTTLLSAICFIAYAQPDTALLRKFIEQQKPHEEAFIARLKSDQYESCIELLPKHVRNKYAKFLPLELKYLHDLLKQHPNPEVVYNAGFSANGVGAFGHDEAATIELQSRYTFVDKDNKAVYSFTLYFTNAEPVGVISNCSTERSATVELLEMRRSLRQNKL